MSVKLGVKKDLKQEIFNSVNENVKALENLFPSVVKDGQVDFKALKEELGQFEEVDKEKYELTWSGKQNAKKQAQQDILGKTLKYVPEDSKNPETTQNLYIEGDNLEVLKLLRQNYYGSIKMIYIDPPYNTGNDFIYNDKFSMSKEESDIAEGNTSKLGERYTVNKDSSNKYHANWFNMMYPRLRVAKDLLTEDGIIFISIDENEVANMRKICDEIFWEENSIGEIVRKTKSKYIYTAPFNSICNQTANNLNKLFKDYNPIDIIEINSNTSINKVYNEDYDINYDLSLLDYQMINYGITLTSHVKLFNLLFSNLRNNNLSLIHLFNSVIVLDEIQAYRVDILAEIIRILDVYSKYMNIKFVIMSATLPNLSKLLDINIAKSSYKNLIKNTEIYFKNPFFKDRIAEYDYSLLDKYKDINYEDKKINIYNDILYKINELIKENGNVKILVEFIKKQTCRDFYEFLKKNKTNIMREDITVREITSEDNKYYRDSVIEEAKILENIIIVSTQTIEAGVDIDMDFGFKNISYIYNEEQFIGRINRSSTKKNSKVFFFNLDDAEEIYEDRNNKYEDYRKGLTVFNLTYRKCLEDKNFPKIFDDIMKRIKKQKESSNIDKSINIFLQNLGNLEFRKINKDLTLIKEKEEFILFLPLNMSIKERVNNEIIDKSINGKDIWKKLKNMIKQNYHYSRFKVEKSEILSEMNYFTYKYQYYNKKDSFENFLINKGFKIDKLNNIYFLDLSENELKTLVDDDYKFNKDAFNNFIKK